jgi:hypothetical protein
MTDADLTPACDPTYVATPVGYPAIGRLAFFFAGSGRTPEDAWLVLAYATAPITGGIVAALLLKQSNPFQNIWAWASPGQAPYTIVPV